MFGKKKGSETVLLLDIESGSVACALVQLSPTELPKVLAYQRQQLPLLQSRSSKDIAKSLDKTLEHSLHYISEVAARMRAHSKNKSLGIVTKADVFFAAPWGTPNLSTGKPTFTPGMREYTKEQIQASLGNIPVSFYTAADALTFGSRTIGKHSNTLVTSLRGELLELLLLNDSGPEAYSTVPLGTRSILRTLKSHGGLTEHEARSMLSLAHRSGNVAYEPLVAAAYHLGDSFADGATLLLPPGSTTNIVVVGEPPLGDWFAKNLAGHNRVVELFSEDATVEALRPHHVAGKVALTSVHDPFILFESLFINSK